jgi:hypothetical protein
MAGSTKKLDYLTIFFAFSFAFSASLRLKNQEPQRRKGRKGRKGNAKKKAPRGACSNQKPK